MSQDRDPTATSAFYLLDQHETRVQRVDGTVTPCRRNRPTRSPAAGNQAIGTAIRLHQRVDYTSNLITQQLYQQNLYQASNATRTIEAGMIRAFGARSTTGALFQRIETFTGSDSSQRVRQQPADYGFDRAASVYSACQSTASLNNDFAYLPYRQVTNGVVSRATRALVASTSLPTLRAALSRLSFLTFNTSASYRTTYYTRSADDATGRWSTSR